MNSPASQMDLLFDGRLKLHQSAEGHRVGTDAILLAAATPALASGLLVDVGAGVGAVGLGWAQLNPDANVVLLEKNPEMAVLARKNIAANDLSQRVRMVPADLFDVAARKNAGLVEAADLVATNPPFLNPGDSRPSPNAARAMAHVLDAGGIEAWLRASVAILKPGGDFVLIFRADALADLLAACAGRLGGIEVLPIFPRAGQKATRLILRGRKGSRAPLSLLQGLILHRDDGAFTPRAEAIHRQGVKLFD